MADRETNHEIDVAAAAWAARLDCGALSWMERRRLEAWATADSRRQGALARAMAILARVGALAPEQPMAAPAAPQRTTLPRRTFLAAASLAAAGVGGAVLILPGHLMARTFSTGRGELLTVPLENGSLMLMNGETRVRVSRRSGRPQAEMLKGEALFEVKRGGSGAFVVQARNLDVSADVGASFALRRAAGAPLQVLVQRGGVNVGLMGGPATELVPGCWASASDSGAVHVQHVGVARIQQALTWAALCGPPRVEPT